MRRRDILTAAAAASTLAGCVPAAGRIVAPPPKRDHQPGVVTPPPGFATLVALDVTGSRPDRPLAALAARIEAATPATVTLGVGASLFDDRFPLSRVRPRALATMPAFPSDVLDPARCHGDLLLQVGAASAEEARVTADDLVRAADGGVRTRWRMDGYRTENTVTAAGLPTTRNLFGFREGAGNPDPRDGALMDRLVWADEGEPAWAAGGTYQVVRLIRFAVPLWNRDPVTRQEEMIGRHRADGAPLAGGPEDARFTYADDPDGRVTPLDAHIRRANPRTADSERHRILRRGYSYGAGSDQGLIFICFQRDIEAGFATVQRRLDGEALERYVLPFGGGYYFVPPSLDGLRSILTTSA
ncbi:Dyp-type peroxidase [Krasilnikovia sp. MM14-A1004]|uniref:Dyp-type peroxidase n=1 Tax=Krasilnikovia sp. MM14-A1004 TaxID=3373541 RepID=UPI00399CDCF1